jgi:pilus assembly protein CpaE
MTVMQVAVLSTDPRLEEALRATGLRVGRLEPEHLGGLPSGAAPPAALVVDVRGQHQLPQGLSAFRKQHPGTGVVLVASTLDPRLMLEAMRAGVSECVQEPVTPQALDQAVRRVIVDALPQPSGQVVAFVGAKGGVGATTLAVNTATALAKSAGGEVLLIDLHIANGDAALFLGAEPRFSVIDALENVHRVDESFFRGVVEKTKVGVDLLGSSDRKIHFVTDAGRVRALFDFAVRRYRFIVLDVPRSDVTMLDALEAAAMVVVVTSQELPSLRSAGRLAQTLRTRYGASRVKAVMNRFDRRAEIAHADVERVIGDTVEHLIPSDYAVAIEALNLGRPVVLEQSRLADAFRTLAADLGGLKKESRQRTGMLGRLAFRRA